MPTKPRAPQPKTPSRWDGFTLLVGQRKGRIMRSHGNWFAVVYARDGRLSSGEYFPYGQPGSLSLARQWCEARLNQSSGRKGTP